MNTIYKYPLRTTDRQSVVMPALAVIISVGLDPQGQLCVWAIVNPEHGVGPREIRVVGTGNPVPPNCEFLGTVVQGPFVWHILVES